MTHEGDQPEGHGISNAKVYEAGSLLVKPVYDWFPRLGDDDRRALIKAVEEINEERNPHLN